MKGTMQIYVLAKVPSSCSFPMSCNVNLWFLLFATFRGAARLAPIAAAPCQVGLEQGGRRPRSAVVGPRSQGGARNGRPHAEQRLLAGSGTLFDRTSDARDPRTSARHLEEEAARSL